MPSPFATILLFLSLLTSLLHAATHYVDADAAGANDGTSWTDAFTSLQDALGTAATGDDIWVAKGIYYPDEGPGLTDNDRDATFTLKSERKLYGGFEGNETLLTQRDPALYLTILSGDLDQDGTPSGNSYHVVSATNGLINADNRLDGFIITAGHADGANPEDRGAGLLCSDGASPTIEGCTFRNNIADWGGAIRNETGAFPTITNCRIENNSAHKGGGGVSNGSPSTPSFTNCAFIANTSGNTGGGVRDASSTPTYLNCSFQGNNAATTGGAIHSHFASITLTNSILWDNTAAGSSSTQSASIGQTSAAAAIPTSSHCLVENWTATDLADPANSLDGTTSTTDPNFASPTVGDLRLLPGSPAINVGDNAANPTTTDLHGNSRIIKDTIDLGAIEAHTSYHVKMTGDDTKDGGSWNNAFRTLQKALTNPSLEPGDLILVAEGIYYPDDIDGTDSDDRDDTFSLPSGVAILGNFPPTGGNTRDPLNYSNILSGDIDQNDAATSDPSTNSIHILTASDTDSHALLDGFTITAGYAHGTFASSRGSGLYGSNSASPVIANCLFLNNSVSESGGAVYTFAASPHFANCSFQSNSATNGGAVYDRLPNPGFNNRASAPLRFNNCTFQDNFASNEGGAILILNSSVPSLTDCFFVGNSATSGGAIYHSSSSVPSLNKCSFLSNTAVRGGALYNNTSSAPSLTDCSFQGNASSQQGGAIYNRSSSPSFIGCTFLNNSAVDQGGAVFNNSSSPKFVSCTFLGNSANFGGALTVGSTNSTSLTNCILWYGSSTSQSDLISNSAGATPTFSHCLVQNWTAADLGDPANSLDGTDPANDPLFVNPGTGNLRLQTSSPAINAGDNSANPFPTDLDGNPRIVGPNIDLGAYEVQDIHAALWLTDLDGDGLTYGIEIATGLDPDAIDPPNDFARLRTTFGPGGHGLVFGRNQSAPTGTILKVMRSTTLTSNSFSEIFRFTPSDSGTDTEPGGGNIITNGPDIFTVYDMNFPTPQALYRLEAEYAP